MHPSIAIRRARASDAQAIARVHVQAWHESYRGLVPDWAIDSRTVEERRTQWSAWLTNEDWSTHVAESNGVVEGFACAYPDASESGYDAYLNTLYVLQSSQRRGIARALLREVVADLVANGCKAMWWLTLKDNPACEFYTRIGASIVREQPAPPELGETVVDRVFGVPLDAFLNATISE